MNELVSTYHLWIVAIALVSARLYAMFTIMPVLSDQMIPGMARRVIVVALGIILVPGLVHEIPGRLDSSGMQFFALIAAKEILLGILIGFLGGIPFWIAENVGNFIDNQRGATMGEVFSPLTGSQDSPIGLLMLQVVSVLFVVAGPFLAFLGVVYESYRIWPVLSAMPSFEPVFPMAFLGIADSLVRLTLVLAAPAVIIMLIATFGLGLINRAVPQMNVFFISMPIKSALGIFILLLYLPYLFNVLREQMNFDIIGFLRAVFV